MVGTVNWIKTMAGELWHKYENIEGKFGLFTLWFQALSYSIRLDIDYVGADEAYFLLNV